MRYLIALYLSVVAILAVDCGSVTALETADAAGFADAAPLETAIDSRPSVIDSHAVMLEAGADLQQGDIPVCPIPVNSGYVDCHIVVRGAECVVAGPWENGAVGCTFSEPGTSTLRLSVGDCGGCK